MGLKNFLFQAAYDLATPDVDYNIPIEQEDDVIDLKDLNIIHTTSMVLGKVKPDEVLVTKNIFGSNKKTVKVKDYGLRGRMPLFQEGYIVDTNDLVIEVNDTKTADGKFSQSIGTGDDIKITLRVTVSASEEPKYASQLVKQQRSYKAAIRRTSERIMRLLINEKLLVEDLDSEDVLKMLNKATSEGMAYNVERDIVTQNGENYSRIIEQATDLLKNYGLIIKDITFADIDLSPNLKKTIQERIGQQDKIKMAKKQAEANVYVAEKEREAEIEKQKAKLYYLEQLKELGMTEADIADYIKRKETPNAIYISGDNNGLTSSLLTANLAAEKQKNGNSK